ncbi:MAG: hypothetical protein KDA65_18670, partial [Planctomycetaceae bacterium]|nr:hypothetical protein [Planctomycetaceae bacterium]
MKIVVLSFDQLSLHWLGCYGNLWLPTPNFDLIATQSTIFDRCYVETVNPEVTSHAWWDGSFRSLTGKSPDKASLFDLLNDFPVEVNLLAEGAAEDHRVPFLSEHHWNQIGEGDEGALVALIDAGVETIRQSATAGDSLLWLKGIGESSFEIPAIAWIEQVAEEEGLEPTEEMLTEWLVIMSQPELFAQLEIDQQQDLLEIFGAARIREIDEQVGRVWREIQSRS